MELVLAKTQDALVLTSLSKRAFDSDVTVGSPQAGGPPGWIRPCGISVPTISIKSWAMKLRRRIRSLHIIVRKNNSSVSN